MKKIAIASFIFATLGVNAQIKTPALSPLSKIEQTVGLTNISVEYSRPSKRGRALTDIMQYGEVWRTGANKNSILTTDDILVVGKDTLKAGSYAIFTRPEDESWTVYLYKNTENWGTPEKWDEKLVALTVKSPITKLNNTVETFTINFDNIAIDGASLNLSWDATLISIPFKVVNGPKVEASIKKTLAGATARDYYVSADYLLNSNGDMKQALAWMNKSIEMSGENPPFYFLRKKSLIQANLKDYKGAIETANKVIEAAKKAGNEEYLKMSEASIKEWSKK